MNDLLAFVSARLDEDEQEAKYALERLSECAGIQVSDPEDGGNIGHMVAYSFHARRHDPARALREVEAKRGIIREHESRDGRCRVCTAIHDGRATRFRAPCPTLLSLAAVFSSHPAYQQEWEL